MHLIARYFGCLKRAGTFLEVGAPLDGGSTMEILERNGSWRGLCIESTAAAYERVRRSRTRCIAVHAMAASARGRGVGKLYGAPLHILAQSAAPSMRRISLLKLSDCGEEVKLLAVLRAFDFDAVAVDVLLVTVAREDNRKELAYLMRLKGFDPQHERIGNEEVLVYVHRSALAKRRLCVQREQRDEPRVQATDQEQNNY